MKLLRFVVPLALAVGLCSCGGSGGGGLFGANPIFGSRTECNTGTQVELASPQAGQTNTAGMTTVTIVASGNNNNLYDTYQNWYVYLSDNFGTEIQGGPLNLVSFQNGPHPYGSDFYYSSQLQQALPPGGNWSAYLTQYNGNCSAVPLQSFSS